MEDKNRPPPPPSKRQKVTRRVVRSSMSPVGSSEIACNNMGFYDHMNLLKKTQNYCYTVPAGNLTAPSPQLVSWLDGITTTTTGAGQVGSALGSISLSFGCGVTRIPSCCRLNIVIPSCLGTCVNLKYFNY